MDGILTSQDYQVYPQLAVEQWQKIIQEANKIKKYNFNQQIYAYVKKNLMRQDRMIFNKDNDSLIDELHEFESSDQMNHTKIRLHHVIELARIHLLKMRAKLSRKFGQQKQKVKNNKQKKINLQLKDKFDRKDMSIIEQVELISKMVASNNLWHNGAVTCIILSILGDKSFRIQYKEFLQKIGLLDMDINSYIKISKMIHEVVRRTGINFNGKKLRQSQRVRYQYLQDLASRMTFKNDWTEDVDERLQDNWIKLAYDGEKFSQIAFTQKRRQKLMQMYSAMKVEDIRPEPMMKRMLAREEFVTAGSSLGSTVTDYTINEDGKREKVKYRCDKRVAMQWIQITDIEQYLMRAPSMILAGINKMENGKNRLLLTTDTIHYYMGEYLCQQIESRLDRQISVDEPKNQIEKIIFQNKMSDMCKQGSFCQSFDWDNFNIQHSQHDMADVWFSLTQYLEEKVNLLSIDDKFAEGIIDYKRVSDWYAMSMYNMWIRSLPDNKVLEQLVKKQSKVLNNNYYIEKPPSAGMQEEYAKAAGVMNRSTKDALLLKKGLASGRRDTNFTNTMLNVAQSCIVMDDVKQIFPEYEKFVIEQLHKGDDIALMLKDELSSILLLIMMRISGQNGQNSKLILGNGEFEFLRQFYASDGKIYGYLRRSIPNIVSTDYQGEEVDRNDPLQLLSALTQQIQKLKIRGFDHDLCQTLEQFMIRKWSKPRKYGRLMVGVNKNKLNVSVIDGGCGLTIDQVVPQRALKIQKKDYQQDKKMNNIYVDLSKITGPKYACRDYMFKAIGSMSYNFNRRDELINAVVERLANDDSINCATIGQRKMINKQNAIEIKREQDQFDYVKINSNPKKYIDESRQMRQSLLEQEEICKNLTLEERNRLALYVKYLYDQIQSQQELKIETGLILQLQKQVARLPIKKKEVLKILFDRWAKDNSKDKVHQEIRYETLMQFISLMIMDIETKNDILSAIQAVSKVLTFNAIYKVVFNNVSFDQIMQRWVHPDYQYYYRTVSLSMASVYKDNGNKLTVKRLQEKVRYYELVLSHEHRIKFSQKDKFVY